MNQRSIILLLTAFITAACSSITSSQPYANDSSFQLFILNEDWHTLNLRYDADPAQSILTTTNTADNLYVVGADQIEEYDWDFQTITLTKKATNELVDALGHQELLRSQEVEKLQELKENLGWGNPIERSLYIIAFVVKVDGQSKYGGIFLDPSSQMAINYPVIRVTIVDGRAAFTLLPAHMPFVMVDPVDGSGTLREASVAPEAPSDAQLMDAFHQLSIQIAESEVAVRFRSLIRDEKIREIFKNSGKLIQ